MTRDRALAAFVVIAPAIALVTAVVLWANGIGPSVTDLVVLAVGTLATMAGVELGYHRYFAHRAFTATPALVWLLGALGSSAFLGPVMWWVTTHRRHHSVTDREGDPHSPHWPYRGTRGSAHAHAGWLFRPEYTGMTVTAGEVKDLWQSSRTIALHRTYLVWAALGLVIPLTVTRTLCPPGIDAPVLNTHVTSLLASSRDGQLPTAVPAVVSSIVPATACDRSSPFGNESLIWLLAAAARSDPAGRSNVVA